MKPGAGLLCCALLVCVCCGALAQGSVKDLIGLAKAKPGELNFSSAGVGNADHYETCFKGEVEKFGRIVRATGLKSSDFTG